MKYEVKKISVIAGEIRKIGEIIELDEKKAAAYLEHGFIAKAKESEGSESPQEQKQPKGK